MENLRWYKDKVYRIDRYGNSPEKFKGMRKLLIFLLSVVSLSTHAMSAKEAIVGVSSYGFVDLEGAKPSAIIVEYNQIVNGRDVSANSYEIVDYVLLQEQQNGYARTIEMDGDSIRDNEGKITRVYVNDKPEPLPSKGKQNGRFVIIELNNDYMLQGSNLAYLTSMMCGVRQVKDIGNIKASDEWVTNYTTTSETRRNGQKQTVYTADKSKVILPQFAAGTGWTLHDIGEDSFHAHHCYSEYTGKYYDFELPYAIYVPDSATMEANKGNIALDIHMEHAGGLDTDPMSGITSSMAAVKLSDKAFQQRHPAIIVVPQVEESRRSTDDYMATSEMNTAAWELIDSLLDRYRGYIDENRIYGTGQSMGGMLLLQMAAQRDNFFAGLALVGAQWGNNYDKPYQHSGSPARSPENDPTSLNGFGLDTANYQNWYYMISDDNVLIHTCAKDPLANGLWSVFENYYGVAGHKMAFVEWDPYLPLEEQEQCENSLQAQFSNVPGGGIMWGAFTRGNHMSTWKYGYRLEGPLEWLFRQNRQTVQRRGKLTQLLRPWLGRDASGDVRKGSGTAGLNSPQFSPKGASPTFVEGWKRP